MLRVLLISVIILITFTAVSQSRLFFPEQTIYIDANNKNDTNQDGTARHPYDSWDDVQPLKPKTRYFFRKGTTYNIDPIDIEVDEIEVGTFGVGDIPVLKSSAKRNQSAITIYNKNKIVFDGIKIESHSGLSCIHIKGDEAHSIQIKGCELTGAEFGVRIIGEIDDIIITNTKIHEIGLDGIYAKYIKTIEVSYCDIYNVNLYYSTNRNQKVSSGDCIQFDSGNGLKFNVHHNSLDRSNNGNKFCFIVQGENYSGQLAYNTFTGDPKNETSCVYLHPTNQNVEVKYNWFDEGSYGIYSYVNNLRVYYNLFLGQQTAIASRENTYTEIYNNLFYQPQVFFEGAGSSSINSFNNIFVTSQKENLTFDVKGGFTGSNNIYNIKIKKVKKELNSIIGDPLLVSPEKNNYMLQPSSPCIDKGKRHEVKKDLTGKLVPNGAGVDIGPFESY